jgi:hypothetical protein
MDYMFIVHIYIGRHRLDQRTMRVRVRVKVRGFRLQESGLNTHQIPIKYPSNTRQIHVKLASNTSCTFISPILRVLCIMLWLIVASRVVAFGWECVLERKEKLVVET